MMAIFGSPPLRGAVLLLAVTLTSAGCRKDSGFIANTGLGYVFDLGNAAKITAWTLRQQDERKIADGLMAVEHIVVASLSYRESERRSAADGYLQLYGRAMAGWPDIRPDPAPYGSVGTEEAQRNLLRYVRHGANDVHVHHDSDPVAHELWVSIVKLDPEVVNFAPPPPDPNGLFGPARRRAGAPVTSPASRPAATPGRGTSSAPALR
jgi:hypothetical protein